SSETHRMHSWELPMPKSLPATFAALLMLGTLPVHADDELTFRTLSRAVVPAGGDHLEYLVARSQADWDRAWSHRSPSPGAAASRFVPAATLDFGNEMAVGVLGASQPDRCTGITIVRIVQEAARIRVDYAPWQARPGEECAPEISTPFHVV